MYKETNLASKLYEIGLRTGFVEAGIPEVFLDSEPYVQGFHAGKKAFEELKEANPYGSYHDTVRPPAPGPENYVNTVTERLYSSRES